MNALVTEPELKAAFGYKQRGALEKCLRQQGLPIYYGKGGMITVPAAALTNKQPETITESIEFA